MKLRKIEISNFRGFPSTVCFDFQGKQNLLVYGENGSGKSSLFHAVQEFFRRDFTTESFLPFRNRFSGREDGHVQVLFDDETIARWTHEGPRSKDSLVNETALRTVCLDYRSLLRTNFVHEGRINLFQVAVESVLFNFPVDVEGGRTTIGALWNDVLAAKPPNRRSSAERVAQGAANRFNAAIEMVIPLLSARVPELIGAFPVGKVELSLSLSKTRYESKSKSFVDHALWPDVKFRGTAIDRPQNFLNEARLSALALAIYFAGLLISVPADPPGAPGYPRVLVLDDVLLGVDMSNRLPVLDILKQHFAGWQVILLTHDKVWFEIVRTQTESSKDWSYDQLFESDGQPVHQPSGKGWDWFITKAKEHLTANDERASAVYARAALEGKLKKYCEKNAVGVRYWREARLITANDFWEAATKFAREQVTADTVKIQGLESAIAELEMCKKIVLNPLSHEAVATVCRAEVQRAIDAVENLKLPARLKSIAPL